MGGIVCISAHTPESHHETLVIPTLLNPKITCSTNIPCRVTPSQPSLTLRLLSQKESPAEAGPSISLWVSGRNQCLLSFAPLTLLLRLLFSHGHFLQHLLERVVKLSSNRVPVKCLVSGPLVASLSYGI